MARGLDELGMIGVNINCSALDQLDRGCRVRAALRGDEPARRRAVLPPGAERHLLALHQRLQLTVPVGRLDRGQRHRAAPDRADASRRKYPNIKYVIPHLGGMISMQLQRLDTQGPQRQPRPAGAAQRHGASPLLRHGLLRLASRVLLRLQGVRRRPPRGGSRLPGADELRDLRAHLQLHPRSRRCRRRPSTRCSTTTRRSSSGLEH